MPFTVDRPFTVTTGFELLESGPLPKHQWRSVTGQVATGTPNIQRGGVGRKAAEPVSRAPPPNSRRILGRSG